LGAWQYHAVDAEVSEIEVSAPEFEDLDGTKHVRGIAMGTRKDFEEMNAYLEEKQVRLDPLVVDQPFSFANAKDVYGRLESGRFYGKMVIKIE
jgi:D-arabinose 1-dehydrogenase-like Zn-dependent alcohol dehydrogenase